MSYDDKVAKAQTIVQGHNNVAKKKVEFETFLSNLQDAGGTTDEALRACTWEDLEKFGLPTLIAKQVAAAFRVRDDDKQERKLISEKKAQAMSARELLDHFDPRNWDTFVGKRLKELSGGKRCIVYNEDGTVNIVTSAKLVDELRDDYPERDNVVVGDRPFKVYAVGERPDQFAFENPLYPGTLLRPDETCDRTNRSWTGVSETVRVLLYLALTKTKEIVITSVDNAHQFIDRATTATAETDIRKRYPKSSLLYDELKARGGLPTLRLSRTQRTANDPFYNAHKRY